MKKKCTLTLALITALVLLVGCTSQGGGTPAAGTGGKTDLLIGLPGGDAVTDMRVVNDFIEARKDQYNITTDEGSWGDFTKKVKLQLVAKNEITPVFFTDSAQAMSFGVQGVLENLDEKVKTELDESKYSTALRAVTDLDGNLWGVPHAMNSIAVIYNKDIFDERGVAYPEEDWTFEDLIKLSEELTFDRDGDGETDVYGIYYITNITQGWYPFMCAYGTSPLSEDFRNSNLDDPKVLDAMKAYQKAPANGWLLNAAVVSADGGIEAAFANGKVAMFIAQSSSLVTINKLDPELNYDAQIMPIGWNGERTCIYVPNVWVISKDIADDVKAASWDWVKYYLNEESQMKIAETTPSGYPVLSAALDKVTNNGLKPEHKDAFYRGIDEFGTTILENPCSTDVNGVVNDMTAKICNNEDVETSVQNAHRDLQETLDYFYEQQGQ